MNIGREHVDKDDLVLQEPGLLAEVLLLPLKAFPLRVAKFDVAIKERTLYADLAVHTMLTRMVHFTCDWCTERFQAFHPAYEPPAELNMELLKRTRGGVALCNLEVAKWNGPPPFHCSEVELVLAQECTGTCRRCFLDIEKQLVDLGDELLVENSISGVQVRYIAVTMRRRRDLPEVAQTPHL